MSETGNGVPTDAVTAVTLPPVLPTGRRAVLFALRRAGDATVEQIAEDLGISVSGVRQHLAALSERGLVATSDEPRQSPSRGRPRHRYHATELADALFPRAYAALTNELLGYLADEDEATVGRLFSRRSDQRVAKANVRLGKQRSLRSKVLELARILDDDGYLATMEEVDRDHFRIIENNCAISDVAKRYRQACASELEFIRAVLPEAEVNRVSHITEGARQCGYTIDRRVNSY
ncbi:MAG: helix-turn-helix transcriptional regulator [Acidimicrobiia bacterium]